MTSLRNATPVTIKDALQSTNGNIRAISTVHGEPFVLRLLVGYIADLVEFFNATRTMSAKQVTATADLIYQEFRHWNPEDFKVCFNKIKLGEYGKLYEGIDGNKIILFMREYDKERIEVLTDIMKQTAAEKRKKPLEIHPVVLEAMKAVIESKQQKKKEAPKPPREKTPYEIAFQKYISEFDKKHREQVLSGAVKDDMVKIVYYHGRNMDVEEYCNKRFDQEFGQENNEHINSQLDK